MGSGEDGVGKALVVVSVLFLPIQGWSVPVLWALEPAVARDAHSQPGGPAWHSSSWSAPLSSEGILCLLQMYSPGLNHFTGKILIAPVWMNCNL